MANKKLEKKRKLSMNPACDFGMFLLKTVGYSVQNNIYVTWLLTLPQQVILLSTLILGTLETILKFASVMDLAKSSDLIPHYTNVSI